MREFSKRLLGWYERNGRHDLPWRKTRDPWLTLLAAALLRKTTGEQVAAVYSDVAKKYGTPKEMAAARASDISKLIHPLGLASRAPSLKRLASEIVSRHSGRVPSAMSDLLELPLVGRYAASEVLSVAYRRGEPALDRNMIRIIQRVFSAKSAKKRAHADEMMWEFAKKLVPDGRPREYNYAIMDFAHLVCKARRPLCRACLMRDICDYGRTVA
jgi:A/G-specific adenine glycosylase